ncbi:hypothetical protein NUW58_g5021 [Xylaria curta]|uniref:Uncharacterized protein n=1 Tax=Xylaria curta TaxID=42375 RepID=A0ACC1P5A9_9PEZI|nr:hypothetical protein NUW58_g5021 [Xylaria curta]
MANAPDEIDSRFRHGVIDYLLEPIDCPDYVKASVREFLRAITTKTMHKHLAYHLFCTINIFISRRTILDEEQRSVLRRTTEQLLQEWSDNNTSPDSSHTPPLHTGVSVHSDASPKQSTPINTVNSLHTEPGHVLGSDTERLARGDVDNLCEAFNRIVFARSSTPRSFVRATEKRVLATPRSHEAISSEDAAHLESQYPFGYNLMTKQGWSDSEGLGPDGSGIRRPIDAHYVTRGFRDHGSSAGLGLASNASSRVLTNGNSTRHAMKQANTLASPAALRNQYIADPHAGDKTAKTVSRAIIRQNAENNTTNEAIAQDQYLIEDKWKDTSNNTSTYYTRENFPKVLARAAKEPSKDAGLFVPYRETSEG